MRRMDPQADDDVKLGRVPRTQGAPDLLACYWTLAGPCMFGDEDYSPWDFRDRVEAAARVGFRGIGINVADLRRTLGLHGYGGMRAILEGNGIRYLELEVLSGWWASGEARLRADLERDLLLATAAELGAIRIKAVGDIIGGLHPPEYLHDEFQDLTCKARAVGTTIALEPIAFSSIPDIDSALSVIAGSAGMGAGLMLDAWHVNRARMPLEQIAALPPGVLAGIELDDGTSDPVGNALQETIERRRLCGDGDFDLVGLVAAAHLAGYCGPWGVEILSVDHRGLTLEAAAMRSFETAQVIIAAYFSENEPSGPSFDPFNQ